MENLSTKNSIDNEYDDHTVKEVVIAFDTSNYTTSVAVVDMEGRVLSDKRRLLFVKSEERGLRQSDALFQHVKNLPELVELAMAEVGAVEVKIVAASSRPRRVEGSYMPVFLAGEGMARSIAASYSLPLEIFSHQEGHIAAARININEFSDKSLQGLAFHLSGGTGEILLTKGHIPVKIVGGTRDISFGQLLDRIGTALGMKFPSGAEMDRIATINKSCINYHYSRSGNIIIEDGILPLIKVDNGFVNLSGIESAGQRIINKGRTDTTKLITELFFCVGDALKNMILNAAEITGTDNVTLAGGVAASEFLKDYLTKTIAPDILKIYFSEPRYSVDNAVGIALLAIDR